MLGHRNQKYMSIAWDPQLDVPQGEDLYSSILTCSWDTHGFSMDTSQAFTSCHRDFEYYLMKYLTEVRPDFDAVTLNDCDVCTVWFFLKDYDADQSLPAVVEGTFDADGSFATWPVVSVYVSGFWYSRDIFSGDIHCSPLIAIKGKLVSMDIH